MFTEYENTSILTKLNRVIFCPAFFLFCLKKLSDSCAATSQKISRRLYCVSKCGDRAKSVGPLDEIVIFLQFPPAFISFTVSMSDIIINIQKIT